MHNLQKEIENIFGENLPRVSSFITKEIMASVVDCTIAKMFSIGIDYDKIKNAVIEEIEKNLQGNNEVEQPTVNEENK